MSFLDISEGSRHLHPDPLYLIEGHLVAAAVIKLRRPRAGGLLQGATVLEIGDDAGRPEAVVAERDVVAGGGDKHGKGNPASWRGQKAPRSCVERAALGKRRNIPRTVHHPDNHHGVGKRCVIDGVRVVEGHAQTGR